MIKPLLATFLAGSLFGVSGCSRPDPVSPVSNNRPRFEQSPADGHGQKVVIPVDVQFNDFITCQSGATLGLHIVGWIQLWVAGQPNNRTVLLDVVHFDYTYSNAAGRTFVWREIGNDRIYIDANGNLVDASTGRIGASGIIGRIVVNNATGEVLFEAGKQFVGRDDLACAALE